MPNNVVYFSIHADDVARARRFYQDVFDWSFSAWGPPNFYLIQTGTEEEPGIRGAVQERREPVEGRGMTGYECTISVEDVDAIARSIENHGGKVVVPKTVIASVGRVIVFRDTEGNKASAMHYDAAAE